MHAGSSQLVQISELIDRIYAAATDPLLWPSVLTEIGRAVSAGTQTLLFLPGRQHLPGVLRCERTPDSVLFPFLEYYSSVNVLAEPCDRMFPDGTVRFSHIAVQDSAFERSEFYADFFRRNQLFYSCGVKQNAPDGGLEYLSMQRERAMEPFGASETAVLQLLMPHIRRALQMQAQLTRHANQVHGAQMALAAFGKVVLAFDARGQISFATADAEALLRREASLYLCAGRLHARDPRIDAQIQQRLRSVLDITSAFARSRGEALLVPQRAMPRNGNQLSEAAATAADDLKLVFLPMRHAGLFAQDSPGALLCISGGGIDAPRSAAPRDAVLRDLFGLTPVEARVVGMLAQGAEVQAIAGTLKKSEAATRFHLKRVFEKTGTNRQTELLRLVSSLPCSPAERSAS